MFSPQILLEVIWELFESYLRGFKVIWEVLELHQQSMLPKGCSTGGREGKEIRTSRVFQLHKSWKLFATYLPHTCISGFLKWKKKTSRHFWRWPSLCPLMIQMSCRDQLMRSHLFWKLDQWIVIWKLLESYLENYLKVSWELFCFKVSVRVICVVSWDEKLRPYLTPTSPASDKTRFDNPEE